jgi:hypothetical protein
MKTFYAFRRSIILISVCLFICVVSTSAWSSNERTKVESDNEDIIKLSKLAASEKECDQAAVKEVLESLENLRFSEEQSEIYNKWDEYLASITHFNNQEHLATIMQMGVDFAISFKKLNECTGIEEKKEKQYSSSWLDSLEKKFGKDYILENRKHIGFIILGISSYHQSSECIVERKDAIYKEAPYAYALHRYVKYFLNFVDTLNKADQDNIKTKTEYAKSIRDIPVDPLRELIAHETLVYALQETALNIRKDFNPALKEFLMQHPSFKELFDFNKALKDLREYK